MYKNHYMQNWKEIRLNGNFVGLFTFYNFQKTEKNVVYQLVSHSEELNLQYLQRYDDMSSVIKEIVLEMVCFFFLHYRNFKLQWFKFEYAIKYDSL